MTRAARLEKARQRRLEIRTSSSGSPDLGSPPTGRPAAPTRSSSSWPRCGSRNGSPHDEPSKIVGYPDQSKVAPEFRRGLRPSEVRRFC